jgi:hypothetical protein
VWRANPTAVAAAMSQRLGIDVRAAHDGLSIDI